jgi:ubiquinone/menaquinone biosynthesis methyltransferase
MGPTPKGPHLVFKGHASSRGPEPTAAPPARAAGAGLRGPRRQQPGDRPQPPALPTLPLPSPSLRQLNERLSFGQHRVWKRMAVRWARATPGHTALDVCCGSGDLAFELASAVGPAGSVTGLDFAAEMLEDAEARRAAAAAGRPAARPLARMRWVQGDALALPFGDAAFDAATMGYGLRNVADIPRALAELCRVLKPGASAAVLDFNNSTDPVVDGVQVRAQGGAAGRVCPPPPGGGGGGPWQVRVKQPPASTRAPAAPLPSLHTLMPSARGPSLPWPGLLPGAPRCARGRGLWPRGRV